MSATSPAPSSASTPLDQPYYGASPAIASQRFWAKYSTFSGRASRSEYWWWQLVNLAILAVLGLAAGGLGLVGSSVDANGAWVPGWGFFVGASVVGIWSLVTLIPNISLTVRRLHDANFSGWWYLLVIISPGALVVLVLTLLASNPLGARFDRRG